MSTLDANFLGTAGYFRYIYKQRFHSGVFNSMIASSCAFNGRIALRRNLESDYCGTCNVTAKHAAKDCVRKALCKSDAVKMTNTFLAKSIVSF